MIIEKVQGQHGNYLKNNICRIIIYCTFVDNILSSNFR